MTGFDILSKSAINRASFGVKMPRQALKSCQNGKTPNLVTLFSGFISVRFANICMGQMRTVVAAVHFNLE